MKRIKICLALVLVVIALFSLTLIAHAEDGLPFTDANNIKNQTPARVLTGLGIINGYPNRTFRPKGNITRAEFCKMLAVLMNGGKDLTSDYSAAATFADTKDHALRAYVGYCVSEKIVAGKNAQTFAPDDKVTHLEAAKMVLVALGHDPAKEGYVGPGWSDNVRTESFRPRSNLFADFEKFKAKSMDDSLTRDNACLLFYNMLAANVVTVQGTSTDYGDLKVDEGLKVVEVENRDFDYMDRQNDAKLQCVEQYFPKMRVKSADADDFGHPCDVWTDGKLKIGPFVCRKPALAGQGSLWGRDIRNAIGEDPTSLDYYNNGVLTDSADMARVQTLLGQPDGTDLVSYFCGREIENQLSGSIAASMMGQIWKKERSSLGVYNVGGSRANLINNFCYTGSYNEVYYDEDTGHAIVSRQLLIPAKVIRSVSAETNEAGEVTANAYVSALLLHDLPQPMSKLEIAEDRFVTPDSNKTALFLASQDSSGRTDYTPDEIIILTVGFDKETNTYVVDKVYRTEVFTGKITGRYGNTKGSTSRFYVNGGNQAYYPVTIDNIFNSGLITVGESLTFYLGTFYDYSGSASSNLVFYATEPKVEDGSNIVYVLKAGTETDVLGEKTHRARLLNSRGSVINVTTDRNYSDIVDLLATFEKDKNGNYVLKKAGLSGLGAFTVKQGNANMELTPAKASAITVNGSDDIANLDFTQTRKVIANDKTLFIVGTKDDETGEMTYTTYTGIKTVPDAESTPYYSFIEEKGVATVVLIYENKKGASESSYGMILKSDLDTFQSYKVGTTGYYEVPAVVDDAVTTLKIAPAVYTSLKYGVNLFNGLSKNADGWITSVRLLDSHYTYAITAMDPVENGVLHLNFDAEGNGGVYLATHDKVHVYAYSLANRALSVITTDELYELGDVAAHLDDFHGNDVTKGYYTLHETVDGKPLAGVFVIVD